MSTVLSRRVSFQPVGYVSARCIGCDAAISVPAGSGNPICPKCQRGQVLADISRLLADIRDLRNGDGVFEGLTLEERNEQLTALGLPPIAAKPRFPGFATMSDDALIDVVAGDACFMPGEREDAIAEATVELARRLDAWTPTPREQAEIERTALVVAGEP
jgi:hypothetical protein